MGYKGMAGIYGIYSQKKKIPINNFNRFYSATEPGIINFEHKIDNFVFGRSVINKFNKDRIIIKNDKYILMLEGILYISKSSIQKEDERPKMMSTLPLGSLTAGVVVL